MKKNYGRTVMLGAMTVSLVAGGITPAFAEQGDTSQSADPSQGVVDENGTVVSGFVAADAQEGTFSYNQTTITPNHIIKNMFAPAALALCNAQESITIANPLNWKLTVSGDVENAFTVTVDVLADTSEVKQKMTCSCGKNPADGGAIITADVKGVPISYLIERAEAIPGANTLTFISTDGTEQQIPLGYAVGRHAVLAYDINGEDLSASVGGNNQLWMHRTSANYFLRDVIEVRITKEEVVPANPGEGLEYPNSPNVGILDAS